MYSKSNDGAAALIFPDDTSYSSALLVSNPPPIWLDDDFTKISVLESGMYCLYLLFFAESGVRAYLTINGRTIKGSAAKSSDGVICTSAVCSIRDAALPCTLGAVTDGEHNGGILLVIKCRI